MATGERSRRAVRSIIGVGHLLVGGAAFVFAGVMVVAGQTLAPNWAECFFRWGCCSGWPQDSSRTRQPWSYGVDERIVSGPH